jgi:hypothetical protein
MTDKPIIIVFLENVFIMRGIFFKAKHKALLLLLINEGELFLGAV